MRRMAVGLLAGGLMVGDLILGGVNKSLAGENEGGHPHQPVTMAELPAAAQKTLKREANGGKIEALRKETHKDGTVVYEAEIVKGSRGTDIEVSADGKVLERGATHDEGAEHHKK